MVAAALAGITVSTAAAQSVTAGRDGSPCPPRDPVAEARLKPVEELFMAPAAAPEAFWAEFARLQSSVLAGDAERNRAQLAADWPNLCRYKSDNLALARGPRPRVVFMGDSITDNWVHGDPTLFANGIVGRGIGGQTSPQMLARFRQDVVALRPRAVHIMAGTNDIAGNTGPTTFEDYQHNILAMIDLARANDIAVIVAAIPPSRKLFWRGDLDPRPQIRQWNEWLRALAFGRGLTFVDYGVVLGDPDGGMRPDVGNDGVHPHRLGYARMRPLAERAIAEAVERAEAPAGAGVSVARREALLRQVAESVSAGRERPADASRLAPPPTPLTNSRAWSAAERVLLWPAVPPSGPFVPATLPVDWPAPFVANVSTPELRIFRAQRPTGQAVLVIPGGGYQFVSVENEGAEFAARLNERGYTVFVLVYRLPAEGWQPGEDVPLQDAQRAMRVIRANAARWSIDARTLAVVGFSAGGHLAATLATAFADPVYTVLDDADAADARPFAAALIYPVVTMAVPGTHPMSRELLLGPNPAPSRVARRSAELHVGAQTPPMLLVHAIDDTAVPVSNSMNLLSAMRAAGRPVEAHLFQEGGHAFASGYPDSPTSSWIAVFDAWLARLRTSRVE
jgi:acetyl esterase/lipase